MVVELYAARTALRRRIVFSVRLKPFRWIGPSRHVWVPGWRTLATRAFSTPLSSVWHTQHLSSTTSAAAAITNAVWLFLTIIFLLSFTAAVIARFQQHMICIFLEMANSCLIICDLLVQYVSCWYRDGDIGNAIEEENASFLNWGCQLRLVDLCNNCKTGRHCCSPPIK